MTPPPQAPAARDGRIDVPVSWLNMPRTIDSYLDMPGPYWYEDRVVGEGRQCQVCNRGAVLLWIFRADGADGAVGMRAICRRCEFTPGGCIFVQQHLAAAP